MTSLSLRGTGKLSTLLLKLQQCTMFSQLKVVQSFSAILEKKWKFHVQLQGDLENQDWYVL